MRVYDQAMLANCAVLIPWNDADPETAQQKQALKDAVESTFPRKTQLQHPHHHWESIRSELDLREKLERVLTEVRMAVLRIAQAQRKVDNQELVKAAEQHGIQVRTKPELIPTSGGR
jgi:hypothetical protein